MKRTLILFVMICLMTCVCVSCGNSSGSSAKTEQSETESPEDLNELVAKLQKMQPKGFDPMVLQAIKHNANYVEFNFQATEDIVNGTSKVFNYAKMTLVNNCEDLYFNNPDFRKLIDLCLKTDRNLHFKFNSKESDNSHSISVYKSELQEIKNKYTLFKK